MIFFLTACPGGTTVDKSKSATRLDLAVEALRAGNLSVAEREANAALGFNPGNEQAHNILGLTDQVRANQAGLLVEFNDCLEGLDAEVLVRERDEGLAAADAHFQKAIGVLPKYGDAWANRGVVALQIEDYDNATKFFTNALEFRERLQPQHIGTTRAHLGWVKFQLGDLPGAAKEFRQALQFDPDHCISLYRLGRVYFARQEWNNAMERFQRVTALPKCKMQEAFLYLSKTEAALGKSEEAARSAATCVSLASKSCLARQCAK